MWFFCLKMETRFQILFAGKVAVGTVIGTSVGDVVHLSFCFTDETVAACSGATVYILCVMVLYTHTHLYLYIYTIYIKNVTIKINSNSKLC